MIDSPYRRPTIQKKKTPFNAFRPKLVTGLILLAVGIVVFIVGLKMFTGSGVASLSVAEPSTWCLFGGGAVALIGSAFSMISLLTPRS